MEIFLDSFEFDSLQKYEPFLHGITTNPLVISKSFIDTDNFFAQLKRITEAFPSILINLQVTETSAEGMIKEARNIADLGPNFIIKVPLNCEGLKALKEISKLGMKTNGTLCFSLFQAVVAQDYGVTYISPFLGRMEDAQDDILGFALNLRKVIKSSKILAASIRNVRHVEIAMQALCDAITLNETVFEKIFTMPLLLNGETLFAEANKFKFLHL